MTAADVRRLRRGLGASQAVFASFLNVSPRLVQAWEGARRIPEGAALRLLELGVSHPAAVFPGLMSERKR
ncbi:MAG: helix-turn-helix domain-containing protein [Gemmatimonadaceae bacterium]